MDPSGSPFSFEKVHKDKDDGGRNDNSDKTPKEVKSKYTKSAESMELLNFFDALPDNQHDALLETLRRGSKNNGKEDFLERSKETLEDYRSAMEDKSKEEKADLYDEYIKAQCKKANAKKHSGKIPSHQLQTGLQKP
jgi:hypothetical protein